ncbi:MAG: glucose-6-phosphate isomerase family protein [Candidatus Njordarchaeales archaeon]
MQILMPATRLIREKFVLEGYTKKIVRRLSDMREFFYDRTAVERILSHDDPIIYEVYVYERSIAEGHLSCSITILYPGKIGKEFYMTKGHFHKKRDRAEVYIGLSGSGFILMMDENEEAKIARIEPDAIVYVPPYHAHRAINTGKEPLVFLAVFPSDAGHDYDTIRKKGFPKLVIEEDGQVLIIDNDKWFT